MARPLNFNRPVRKRARGRHYRVCVNDTVIYAKVFRAYSPLHALKLASIDTEKNRDWRADWEIISGGTGTFITRIEEVRA